MKHDLMVRTFWHNTPNGKIKCAIAKSQINGRWYIECTFFNGAAHRCSADCGQRFADETYAKGRHLIEAGEARQKMPEMAADIDWLLEGASQAWESFWQ